MITFATCSSKAIADPVSIINALYVYRPFSHCFLFFSCTIHYTINTGVEIFAQSQSLPGHHNFCSVQIPLFKEEYADYCEIMQICKIEAFCLHMSLRSSCR